MIIECVFVHCLSDPPFNQGGRCADSFAMRYVDIESRKQSDSIFFFDTDDLNKGYPENWSKVTLRAELEKWGPRVIRYFFTNKSIMGAYFYQMVPVLEFDKKETERRYLYSYLIDEGFIKPLAENYYK